MVKNVVNAETVLPGLSGFTDVGDYASEGSSERENRDCKPQRSYRNVRTGADVREVDIPNIALPQDTKFSHKYLCVQLFLYARGYERSVSIQPWNRCPLTFMIGTPVASVAKIAS